MSFGKAYFYRKQFLQIFFRVCQGERMPTTVMDMLEELLEKIILPLDPISAINFSLCATRLHGLVSNHVVFLRILDKVEFKISDNNFDEEAKTQRKKDNQELVDKLRNFICTTSDPGPLLARLQETISLQFPAKGRAGTWVRQDAGTWEWVGEDAIVLERHLHQPLHVDAEGVLLLLHAREGLSLGSVSVGSRNEEVRGGLLAALSCLANQTPGRGLDLQVLSLKAVTEEDGLALAQLLAVCGDWAVGDLYLSGQVGQEAWQGLAMAAGRGKVKTVIVDREVIKRGAREDLRGAWECTDSWVMDWYAFVNREDGEEGWRKIEEWNNEGESLDDLSLKLVQNILRSNSKKGLKTCRK